MCVTVTVHTSLLDQRPARIHADHTTMRAQAALQCARAAGTAMAAPGRPGTARCALLKGPGQYIAATFLLSAAHWTPDRGFDGRGGYRYFTSCEVYSLKLTTLESA